MDISKMNVQLAQSLGIQPETQAKIAEAVASQSSPDLVEGFSRLAPSDLPSLLASQPPGVANVSQPVDAFQTVNILNYPAMQTLESEGVGVQRVQVNGDHFLTNLAGAEIVKSADSMSALFGNDFGILNQEIVRATGLPWSEGGTIETYDLPTIEVSPTSEKDGLEGIVVSADPSDLGLTPKTETVDSTRPDLGIAPTGETIDIPIGGDIQVRPEDGAVADSTLPDIGLAPPEKDSDQGVLIDPSAVGLETRPTTPVVDSTMPDLGLTPAEETPTVESTYPDIGIAPEDEGLTADSTMPDITVKPPEKETQAMITSAADFGIEGADTAQLLKISPTQIEEKILTDPDFRNRIEEQIGGKLIIEGNQQLDMAVEKNAEYSQIGSAAASQIAEPLAARAHIDRIESSFAHVLSSMRGPQVPGENNPAQMLDRFAELVTTTQFPAASELTDALKSVQSGEVQGLLGGTSGRIPGFLSAYRLDTPEDLTPDNIGKVVQELESNVRKMQAVLRQVVDVFDKSQSTMQQWRIR